MWIFSVEAVRRWPLNASKESVRSRARIDFLGGSLELSRSLARRLFLASSQIPGLVLSVGRAVGGKGKKWGHHMRT